MRLFMTLAFACACACVTETERPQGRSGASVQRRSARVVEPCVVSGCSGQICAQQPLFSTCEWRLDHACFAGATCAPLPGGGCGWTMTDELRACLDEAAKAAR
jgi:hypothetical protein